MELGGNGVIDEALLTVHEYTGEGYLPLIDYGQWRVAILRYIDELLPHKIASMQRHDETDEVFVLLEGRCILFIGEGDERISEIYAQDLQPLKLYNVKRSCWHTHVLDKDASVLIVENMDTTDRNSPQISLDASQREKLVSLTRQMWG
jgi:hypothetical protein